MADNIVLKTWLGQMNTATDDAIIRDAVTQMSGILRGCDASYSSGNIIHMAAGYGMIKGRLFEMYDTDIQVALPASGTLKGRIYIHMDLSNVDEPITVNAYTGNSLPELTHDENVNYNNGIYDIELITFTAGTVAISDIKETVTRVNGILDTLLKGQRGFTDKRTIFRSDGTIKTVYGDNSYTITDFPTDVISTEKLYSADDKLILTKTTIVDNATGDIVETVTEEIE